jgi:ABC transporter substrate binding protein
MRDGSAIGRSIGIGHQLIGRSMPAPSRPRGEKVPAGPRPIYGKIRAAGVKRADIIALAAKARIPAIYPFRAFPAAGGLMSFGTDEKDLFRKAAMMVDKILKGAKPSDLPVEQPTKFELIVNLSTAKALGLTLPESILAQTNEVIE